VLNVVTEAQKNAAKETKSAADIEKEAADKAAQAAKNKAEINSTILENEIKQLTYTKNRREAMGKDTYNVQKQIYHLQQKLYKDDVDKYEEATVNLLKLETERTKKIKEEADKKKKIWVDSEMKYYEQDKAISDLLKKSQDERERNKLKGAEKEDLAITQRWDTEIAKYADHLERKKELEDAKEAELLEAREKRATESVERIRQIELQSEQERLGRIFTNAAYLREFEAENQMQRAIEKAESEGASEAEIAAIRKQYAEKNNQTGIAALDFFIALKNSEVKWSELTEKQKLAITKQVLNMVADMAGEGTGAWKVLKTAEALIKTKQAAIAAYQALVGIPIVGPVLGPIAAGVVTAYGLKQVADIANTKIPKAKKFFDGGYTGTDVKYNDQYGGVTQVNEFHGNEWVAPAIMTENPKYANVIGWLERERKGIQAGAAGSAATAPPVATQGAGQAGGSPDITMSLFAVLADLNTTLKGGIKAKAHFGYEDMQGFNDLNKDISTSTNNGTLNS